jgi:leader peptidase (prepilin peptidase)/N-methyltransferase
VLAAGCGIGGVLAGPLLDALARAVPLEQPVLPLRRPGRLTVVVSLVTGVLAALVALAFDGAVLAVLLVAGALLDGRPGGLLGSAVTAGALFALFLLAAVVSPSGMGMGDVKLAGVLGLALGLAGTAATLLAVLVAFALHAVVSVVLLATRRAGRRTALPFGPALLVGAGVALGWLSPLAA